jgi:hypothetical protein
MLDVSNEEPLPHSDIFPSSSHEDIYMSISENDDTTITTTTMTPMMIRTPTAPSMAGKTMKMAHV